MTVRVSDEAKGTIADENGVFEIKNLCTKEFDLVISHVGYKATTHHHDTYHEHPTILLAADDHILKSVVVEGDYNPTNMNTIDVDQLSDKEFSAAQSESLGDLAGRVSGVATISTGQNIVKPIIHGLHSNRVLIINNGVRHEFQNWGVEHAPEIDPSLAASLEVVKGAATVRYGPDALGGVILIHPPRLELSSGFQATLGATGKSNGRSAEGNLSVQHGWRNLVLAGQGSFVRQGDLHTPDYQLTNTGKQEQSYAGAFRFHRGSFDLEGYYSRFYQNLGILRASVNGNLQDLANAIESPVPPDTQPFSYIINTPRQEVTHDLFKLKGAYILENQDVSFQYAYQVNHRREFDVRRGTNNEVPSINLKLASHSVDLDWNHPTVGPFQGAVGFQGLYQDNNNIPGTNTVPFVPNYNNTRLGVFAIERVEQGATTYEAGVRYDYQYSSVRGRAPDNAIYRNTLSYSQVTGSLGVKKEVTSSLAFRSNLGMAWRPPNISELYSFGKHQASIEYGLWRYQLDERNNVTVDGVLSEEDKEVKSEVGFKWINSWEWKSNRTQWEITAYANLINNYIYTRPAGITTTVRGAFPYFVYDQDDALLWGVDATWKQLLYQDWQLEAQGNYVWAKDITNNETFTAIPPARLDLSLSYDRRPDFLSKSSVGIGLMYTFRYFQQPRVISVRELLNAEANDKALFAENDAVFDFTQAPEGYFLTNISWSAGARRWEWTLRISNLLNTRYRIYTDRLRYFADQTGRNVRLSVQYTLR